MSPDMSSGDGGPASAAEPAMERQPATFFDISAPAVATGAAFFMIVLDTSIVNLALARIGAELHAGLATLQWLVDGYLLVFASLLLGAGALGDRVGARVAFACGLLVFTVASACCGLAPSIGTLQIARIAQGIGAALLLPNSLAALNSAFADPDRRSKAIALWASAGAAGVALGPVLGGFLVETLGWRAIFIVNVPVGPMALQLTHRRMAAGPRDRSRAFDPLGQLLSVGTLAAATYVLIGLGHPTAGGIPLGLAAAASLAFAIGFVAVETRHRSPMLPLDLLRRPALGPVALVGLLHNAAIYGLIFVLSLAFQHLRGLNPLGAGLLFLPLTLALAIGTRGGALALRRCGPFGPLIWGHLAAAIGAFALAVLGGSLTAAGLTLPLVVIGAGAGATTPAMNLAALDSVSRAQGGLASGVLNSARQTGGVIGVAVLGALLGEPATFIGAEAAEYVAAGLLCLASALAVAAGKRQRSF